jgi:hypothetical protein
MIFDNLFSERNTPPCQKLVYDKIDDGCRLQIKFIVEDFFENNHIRQFCNEHIWPHVREGLKRAHKSNSLYAEDLHKTFGGYISASAEVLGYFETQDNFKKAMDIIEVVFRMIADIERLINGSGYPFFVKPDQAIEQLNICLQKNCVGYKFTGNMLIRIDNELLYSNITKKTLLFLSNPEYFNINEEYLQAHRHYRNGDYEDCIVNCNKAFESTMKVICDKRAYPYDQSARVTGLVAILINNHFFPPLLLQQITGIRKTLEEGISVIRNNKGGHGKGTANVVIDENLTSYTVNLTGSAIKFLLDILEKNQKPTKSAKP